MSNSEVSDIAWSKSSYSGGDGGHCIEFSRSLLPQHTVPVRDSKDPQGPVLTFTPAAWQAFVEHARTYAV